jgi:hypothetical protein
VAAVHELRRLLNEITAAAANEARSLGQFSQNWHEGAQMLAYGEFERSR